MKNKTLVAITVVILAVWAEGTRFLHAQDKPVHQRYEYALLKWDGPDRIQIFYPDKFDSFRVFEKGNVLPKNAHDEEFCVNLVVNDLAREGWEPIQLHATRVMLRRAVVR